MQKKHGLILIILMVGVGLLYTIVKTAPKPQKKSLQVMAPLVETRVFQAANERPIWQGGAAVDSNASVKLVALVAGQITHIPSSVMPGAFVKQGSKLAHIDDASYQLVHQQKRALVTQAQASLDIELAQVQNAKSDYRLSGMPLNKNARALALRAPQLASARAALASAEADLAKAQLDLDRSSLLMPFDGHVMQQLISVGGYVNNATPIFEIVNSAAYWLAVKVPQNFMAILDQAHAVTINKQGSDETRTGKILSILPQVDGSDRQARVLISIEDPLALSSDTSPIRYNDYVQVTLYGQRFENLVQLSSDDLNGEQNVWVVDKELTLQRRPIEVLFKGRVTTWARVDMQAGDELLSSRLAVPRVGMEVRLQQLRPNTLAEQEGEL
ncbi:MAG: HlyD family efflux transporter periplasmic adaptor subunit [Bermanella sp.]